MTPEEIPSVAVYSILDLVKPGEIVCEIGVRSGQSSYAFLHRGCFLYMIDPWEEYEEYIESSAYRFEDDYSHVLEMVKEFPNQYQIIREKSGIAHRQIPNNLSLVYIDGNHAYDYVLQDILNYWPKLKKGGWLTGDDYSMSDIQKAVNEVYSEWCKIDNHLRLIIIGRNWAIQKL